MDSEKKILEDISKTSIAIENYLKEEFEHYKKRNLANMKEYYQQLFLSDRLKFENQIDNLKREHNKIFNEMKLAFEKYYKGVFDNMVNKNLHEKLMLTKPESILNSSHKTSGNNDMLKSQVTQKLKNLNRKDQQIYYLKDKIKTILNNYVNLVIFTEESSSSFNYVLDIEKMYRTYLECPASIENKRMKVNDKRCHK